MTKVIAELKKYDELYHQHGESSISDSDYDIMKEIAFERKPKDSYFKTIGSSSGPSSKKENLPYYMGSMDKIKLDNSILTKFKTTYKDDTNTNTNIVQVIISLIF